MAQVIDWLMEGDPAIRWQTLRDLLDVPEQEWRNEQQRTQAEGWGAQFLALQAPNGSWGGGLYSPKWISTTYTLLTLCSIGLPSENAAAGRGARLLLDKMLGETCSNSFQQKLAGFDILHAPERRVTAACKMRSTCLPGSGCRMATGLCSTNTPAWSSSTWRRPVKRTAGIRYEHCA